MNVGAPVVGWVETGPLRTSAILANWNVGFQTAAWLCFGTLFTSMGYRIAGVMMFCLSAVFAAFFGWMAWLQWQALKKGWGSLHARSEGSDILIENPFNLALGKKKRFPRGDTVTLSVRNRVRMGRPQSGWTVSGSRSTVVFYAKGPWTEARWYELGEGLHRLGFAIAAEPKVD